MSNNNLMLNKMICALGIYVPIHIPNAPQVLHRKNGLITFTSSDTNPPHYQQLYPVPILTNRTNYASVSYNKILKQSLIC